MKIRLGVIFGGKSVEHEISVITAMQVIAAVDRARYSVTPIYIAKDGSWYSGQGMEQVEHFAQLPELLAQARRVSVLFDAEHPRLILQPNHFWQAARQLELDLILPIMHGSSGEDGSLQGLLEMLGVPYVGCGVLGSAIGMDKVATKWAMRSIGVPVVEDYWFYSYRWLQAKDEIYQELHTLQQQRGETFSYPLIVKPADLGSSVGVQAVNNESELEAAVDLVARLSNKVLIEPKVTHLREINCAALGDREEVITSVCEEPLFKGAIQTYQDKYQRGGGSKQEGGGGLKTGKLGAQQPAQITGSKLNQRGMNSAQREIPAKISSELTREIKALTAKVFYKLDCNGVIRVDYLWDEQKYQLYLCEINTIPGSLAFYLWDYQGISFGQLVDRLIQLALKRHREHRQLIRSYTYNILSGK